MNTRTGLSPVVISPRSASFARSSLTLTLFAISSSFSWPERLLLEKAGSFKVDLGREFLLAFESCHVFPINSKLIYKNDDSEYCPNNFINSKRPQTLGYILKPPLTFFNEFNSSGISFFIPTIYTIFYEFIILLKKNLY